MNEQKVREAIKYFKKEIDFAERRKSDCSETMLSVFEDEIDTANTVIEALEKQLPKKPIERHYEEEGEEPYIKVSCPNGCRFQPSRTSNYCRECGQRLDWSE